MEFYDNEKLYSEGCIVQTFDRISDKIGDPPQRVLDMLRNTGTESDPVVESVSFEGTEDEPYGWYGKRPFHKLNDTKLLYCRNRYLLPDILTKAKDENTASHIFNAKNSFSCAKTGKKLALDHSCRTGCCVACKNLKDSMKTKVVAQKTSYNGVKSGNVIAVESDENGCDNITHIQCECQSAI